MSVCTEIYMNKHWTCPSLSVLSLPWSFCTEPAMINLHWACQGQSVLNLPGSVCIELLLSTCTEPAIINLHLPLSVCTEHATVNQDSLPTSICTEPARVNLHWACHSQSALNLPQSICNEPATAWACWISPRDQPLHCAKRRKGYDTHCPSWLDLPFEHTFDLDMLTHIKIKSKAGLIF